MSLKTKQNIKTYFWLNLSQQTFNCVRMINHTVRPVEKHKHFDLIVVFSQNEIKMLKS